MKKMQGFEYSRRVYYYDTDAGGVVYHGNYFHFCEEARTDIFLKIMGKTITEYAKETDCAWVISKSSSEYKRSIMNQEEFVVRTYIDDMGAIRTKYRHEIFVGDVLCAVVKIECVSISATTLKPMKMPQELVEAYRAHFGEDK